MRASSVGIGIGTALLLLVLGLFASMAANAQDVAPGNPTGASVSTDQADYQPGETVIVSGAGWASGEAVHIRVEDDGGFAWSYDSSPDPVADVNGNFQFSFQLPNYFVANYRLTATGPISGTATTTFTDLAIGTYDQCSNDDGDGYATGDTGCRWINGNLQKTNSTLFEGDSTVQRLWLTGLAPNSVQNLTLEYGTTRGGAHAYDFLTTWDQSEGWIDEADRCQDITGCTSAIDTTTAIPNDPEVPDLFENAVGARNFVMRGGNLQSSTAPSLFSGSYAGNSETRITVTFTTGPADGPLCPTTGPEAGTCGVVLWFGAHVAQQSDWGVGNGASDVQGSPYHVSLAALNGDSVGNRDNQMQASAVVINGRVVIVKDAVPNDEQDFDFSLTGQPNFNLDDDDDLTLPNSRTFFVPPGEYSAQELNIPSDWTLSDIVCVDPTNNSTVNVEAATASINVAPAGQGDTSAELVECTFTNTKDGRIEIEKQTLPDGASQKFTFAGDVAGELGDGESNGKNVAPGTYSSTETVPDGWDLTDITCDDGDSSGGPAPGEATFNVSPGETVRCVFTNTKDGRIEIEKQTLPDGASQKFTFAGDVAGELGDGESNGKNVAPGTYSSTETVPDGWDLTDITCDDGDSSGGPAPGEATFNVSPGETVRCVFTNTKDGRIEIEKQTLPDGASQKFTFAGDVAGELGDGESNGKNVAPGTYSSTETVPDGWDLTDITCDDGDSSGGPAPGEATFNVSPGETVRCVFTNTKDGRIEIEKQTLPDGASQKFTFAGDVAGELGDGESNGKNVAPGTYSSTETVPDGWDLTDITCDDGDSSGGPAPGEATFNVSPGETVRCVFTNTKDGRIEIEKQTLPDGASQKFTFAGDVAGELGDGESNGKNVAPGTYSSTETVPDGWDLTDITCDDGDSSGGPATGEATFNVSPGETVRCVFTNTKDGRIEIEKQTLPDGASQKFTFAGDVAGELGDGESNGKNVAPGTYSSTETVPDGWDLTDITCDDGDSSGGPAPGEATFNVSPGETVRCVFTNTKDGRIEIEKQTLPDGASQKFTFAGDVAGELGDGESNGKNVAPGTYSSTETVPDGWDLTDITCDDGDSSGGPAPGEATFNVSPGETVRCVFTNTKDGRIEIEKQTLPDGASQKFTFAGDVAGELGDGESNGKNVAPGTYSSTETVPDGWDLTDITCDDGDSSGGPATGEATFNVSPGETVRCVFTNTKDGRIEIEKQTLPDGASQKFTFAGDVAGELGDGESNGKNVAPGTYSSTETVPDGWDLTDITCDDGDSSGGPAPGEATFNVSPGETVRCVFTNTKDGRIEIEKQTLPDGASQKFTFAGDVAGELGDGESNGKNVAPGTYSSTETVPDGWDLTDITCDDGDSSGGPAPGEATFNVSPGETVRCVFTNTKDGRIEIEKQTLPDGASQKFTFAGDVAGELGDGESNGKNVAPGTYSSTETVPDGWDLTDITCDDGDSSGGPAPGEATFNVSPGETVRCVFTNTKDGRIEIEKQTLPDGASQKFTFAGDVAGELGDGESNGKNVAPGTYSSTETVPDGWDLTDITCDDGDSSGGPAPGEATFNVSPGETVRCVFTNTKDGRIEIEKQTLPDGASQKFTFAGDVAGELGDGESNGKNVAPGTYSSTETVPDGWDLTDITCDDGDSSGGPAPGEATFNVSPGETVRCVFTNTKDGRIEIEKQTLPDGASQKFTFAGDVAGELGDGESNGKNVAPGTYSSTETVPDGWDLTDITCDDGDSSGDKATGEATFNVSPGETVRCVFTNTKRGMVEILKTTDGQIVGPGVMTWNFSLTNGISVTDTQDNNGVVDFGGAKLIPGNTYRICETGIPAGWTLTWKVDTDGDGTPDEVIPFVPSVNNDDLLDGGSYSRVFDPNYVDPPAAYTNDTRCVNFKVEAGQTLNFSIDNSFPGGEPRTIGYWKNWSSCTGGNQFAVAAKNGGPDAGWYTLDDLLNAPGFTIGVLVLDGSDCDQAVRLLNKSDVVSGKKKASDAAYGLAAQLLAAEVNLSAGAETCAAVTDAVTAGQNLLASINFNGSGNYLGPKLKPPRTAAERTLANNLAATLDQYNNGLLCP